MYMCTSTDGPGCTGRVNALWRYVKAPLEANTTSGYACFGVPSLSRDFTSTGGYVTRVQVSRASVYKQLLENSLRVLLDKIPHLEEKTMLDLLNDSFR